MPRSAARWSGSETCGVRRDQLVNPAGPPAPAGFGDVVADPPDDDVFSAKADELTALDTGWRDRMPIIQLRQHLAVLAQFDDDWGAYDQVRATLAPFRPRGG